MVSDGRVVASGTVQEVVDGGKAAVVAGDDWVATFDALQRAGLPAVLVGSTLRVPGAGVVEVRRALAGRPAEVREEPVTLEERFLQLSLPPERAVRP